MWTLLLIKVIESSLLLRHIVTLHEMWLRKRNYFNIYGDIFYQASVLSVVIHLRHCMIHLRPGNTCNIFVQHVSKYCCIAS